MLSSEVRGLVTDYQEALTATDQSVEASGTVFCHETLVRDYMERVCKAVLASLAGRFGVDDVFSITVASPGPTRPEQGNPGENENPF